MHCELSMNRILRSGTAAKYWLGIPHSPRSQSHNVRTFQISEVTHLITPKVPIPTSLSISTRTHRRIWRQNRAHVLNHSNETCKRPISTLTPIDRSSILFNLFHNRYRLQSTTFKRLNVTITVIGYCLTLRFLCSRDEAPQDKR